MGLESISRIVMSGLLVLGVSACGVFNRSDSTDANVQQRSAGAVDAESEDERGSTIWDLFGNQNDPNVTVAVNKYLWQASLEVLNFLPVESVDPFSGVITTGYGVPPGGGRAYRATVYVEDPALEARSLKVALYTRGGPVDAETTRAVEDAILTRARQLRIRDGSL